MRAAAEAPLQALPPHPQPPLRPPVPPPDLLPPVQAGPAPGAQHGAGAEATHQAPHPGQGLLLPGLPPGRAQQRRLPEHRALLPRQDMEVHWLDRRRL